jgi:hypothetical protein
VSLQSGLGLLSYHRERSWIRESDLSQHLSVEVDLSVCEPTDELAVRETVQARSSIDSNDPETTKITLLSATISVGKLQRLLYGSLRKLETSVTTTAVSFRQFKATLVTSSPRCSSLNSHSYLLTNNHLRVRQHPLDVASIGLIDQRVLNQISLALGALLAGVVAVESLGSLYLAVLVHGELFTGSPVCFYLWHKDLNYSLCGGFLRENALYPCNSTGPL